MPTRVPKGILLHGGPPSDSSFCWRETINTISVHGASEDNADAYCGMTTTMCHIHQ